jgi:hypothetical protein
MAGASAKKTKERNDEAMIFYSRFHYGVLFFWLLFKSLKFVSRDMDFEESTTWIISSTLLVIVNQYIYIQFDKMAKAGAELTQTGGTLQEITQRHHFIHG